MRTNLAFEALADPTRRAILSCLADRPEARAGEIAVEVGTVSRTGVSSHLRILKAAELVRERRAGRYRFYSLERDVVDEVVAFLAGLYRTPLREARSRAEESAKHIRITDSPASGLTQRAVDGDETSAVR